MQKNPEAEPHSIRLFGIAEQESARRHEPMTIGGELHEHVQDIAQLRTETNLGHNVSELWPALARCGLVKIIEKPRNLSGNPLGDGYTVYTRSLVEAGEGAVGQAADRILAFRGYIVGKYPKVFGNHPMDEGLLHDGESIPDAEIVRLTPDEMAQIVEAEAAEAGLIWPDTPSMGDSLD